MRVGSFKLRIYKCLCLLSFLLLPALSLSILLLSVALFFLNCSFAFRLGCFCRRGFSFRRRGCGSSWSYSIAATVHLRKLEVSLVFAFISLFNSESQALCILLKIVK